MINHHLLQHSLIKCNNFNHLNQLFHKSKEIQQFHRKEEKIKMEKLI